MAVTSKMTVVTYCEAGVDDLNLRLASGWEIDTAEALDVDGTLYFRWNLKLTPVAQLNKPKKRKAVK